MPYFLFKTGLIIILVLKEVKTIYIKNENPTFKFNFLFFPLCLFLALFRLMAARAAGRGLEGHGMLCLLVL